MTCDLIVNELTENSFPRLTYCRSNHRRRDNYDFTSCLPSTPKHPTSDSQNRIASTLAGFLDRLHLALPELLMMASSAIKPGVPIALQDLRASSKLFKHGASLRITGKLESYSVESAVAVIVDGSSSLCVDTEHLRNTSFRVGSLYQFIGELVLLPNNDAILQARIGRNVDGMDLNLYHQSLQLLRQFEAELASAKTA